MRMQIWQPQLSRRLWQITGGTMFFISAGQGGAYPNRTGRRRPHTKLSGGEVDAETTRAATMATAVTHTSVIGLSVLGGRMESRDNCRHKL